jgi:Peptidase family S41
VNAGNPAPSMQFMSESTAKTRDLLFTRKNGSGPSDTPPQPVRRSRALTALAALAAFTAFRSFAADAGHLIDTLPPDQLKQVLEELRANYIDPKALTSDEVNSAAVKGLLTSLGPGLRVQSKAEFERAKPVRPFRYDVLQNQFGYIRMGTLKDTSAKELDNALSEVNVRNLTGLILDLRTAGEESDYDLAEAVIDRFIGNGETTFELVQNGVTEPKEFKAGSQPAYTGPMTVLASAKTAGAAEVIAGVLKAKRRALIIGQTTSGRAVRYKTEVLGDLVVEVADSKVVIPGGPSIFPEGLAPDITVNVSADLENQVLTQTDAGPIEPYIQDEVRRHLNEAALVNGTNPELDEFEQEQAGKVPPPKPKDETLQRATDFLVTLNVYRRR